MATCQINEKGFGLSCPLPALESDPEGLCILHSPIIDKDKVAFESALKDKVSQKYFNFRAVVFPSDVSFSGQILAEADFANATFYGRADFQKSVFSGKADFSKAIFQEADFSKAAFQNADFTEATFNKANFSYTNFQDGRFSGATFQEASFNEAIFKEVIFFRATFQNASFYRATFQNANYTGARFHRVSFIGSNFQGLSFSATFHKADFTDATFQNANFFMATFQDVTLWGVKINGLVIFGQTRLESTPKRMDLRFIKFGDTGVLRLKNLSLARAKFAATDLRRVEFHNIEWQRFWGRNAVYDEVLLFEQKIDRLSYTMQQGFIAEIFPFEKLINKPDHPTYEQYLEVEKLYRYLKINYEEERDLKSVGNFYYGEMEMHRRANPWRQLLPISWHNLYHELSGYGEGPSRSLIWLLIFLFGLSALVWWCGIAVDNYGNLAGFWESFIYILQKATLQRPDWPKPITWGGRFLSSLSVLLLPGQAALFILALRNRLGRRR
jgi:uncharacterized protein YjbI with pentapeptide repeats